jgi:hypothetical protein
MRKFLLCVLTSVSFACGGGSNTPTAPSTPPPPPPLPQADIRPSGQGSWTSCIDILDVCSFDVSIQNVGQGCATGTTVVVRFFDMTDRQVGSDVQMGSPLLASRTIRPNEILAVTSISRVPGSTARAATKYQLFPTWTNVPCQ